jgi:ATP-dependent Lon protease
MTTEVTPALPDRSELRKLYDAAVSEINESRDNNLLNGSFYRKTRDAVFEVGCLALSDAATDTRMMHTVSAPPGGGKTTFAHAFAVALTRTYLKIV